MQALLRPYLVARKKMHLLYKVVRSESEDHLHQQFAIPWPSKTTNTAMVASSWPREEARWVERAITT